MQHHLKELSAHESVAIFRALGSTTRAKIVELLSVREMNIGELSTALGLTQPSVTKHVQVLEEAGLVRSDYVAAPQGTQKKCRCVFERLLVDLEPKAPKSDGYAEVELPVGMFTEVDARPTCGLATKEKFIGLVDAPVSFYLPERSQAEILWSAGGWVEYAFANTLPVGNHIKAIELVMELSSEAPGYNNTYPSDITVWMNGVEVGTWTSPGDFGGSRGQLNPSWYPDNMNQWGVLKTWSVDMNGASIDGFEISKVTVDELNILPWAPTKVRIGIKPDAQNQGGFTLYGRCFGNYQLGLILRIRHENLHPEMPTSSRPR
ncbi:MAG: metalloregulator ArsR/SmtB family transcription factor [Armatimonadetes bacterium]|nr:metalloregulator ArsR/SmtB family transcription factor [Armatimonadota bacterium]